MSDSIGGWPQREAERQQFEAEDAEATREALHSLMRETAALRTALAAATARSEEMELMLRYLLPCHSMRGGPKAPDGKWIILEIKVDDDGTNFPKLPLPERLRKLLIESLTPAARAALAETRKEGNG